MHVILDTTPNPISRHFRRSIIGLGQEGLMEQLEFLRNVGLFRDLNDEQLRKVEPLIRLDERKPEEIIYREGDDAKDVCVVLDGYVDLRYEMPSRKTSRGQTVSTILPGRVFGWSALVPPYKITLSSYPGDQGCKFYRISGKALIRLFEEDPRVGYLCMSNLARLLASRFRNMEDEAVRLGGLNLKQEW
jgi:CRP-like cAMP-binding protein